MINIKSAAIGAIGVLLTLGSPGSCEEATAESSAPEKVVRIHLTEAEMARTWLNKYIPDPAYKWR